MLEYFCEWIQKIAYYMILVTIVMQVAAGEGYRKYIRLFTGIILILFIVSPVIHFLDLDGEDFLLTAESEYETAAEQIEEKIQRLEEETSVIYEGESFMGVEDQGGTGFQGGDTGTDDEAGKAEETEKIEVGEIRIGR